MKNQNNQRLQSLLLATIATIFLLGASASTFAQAGSGAKFGTRDPRTCADMKAPARGAMTTAQAAKYLLCKNEKVSGNGSQLLLVEDLTVEVGGGVPYNPKAHRISDIDTTALVYPLRASYKGYQCEQVSDNNKGHNCTVYYVEKQPGNCYKTTFGDWSCLEFAFTSSFIKHEDNMPPPKGGTNTAAANAKDKPAAKTDKQTAEPKTEANATDPETGLPKPDFSEMEKYFEIVRWEYSTADRQLKILFKMTNKTNVCYWDINFYDADGVKVSGTSSFFGTEGCSPELGEPSKAYTYLPQESKWKSIKKVVITRHIY